MVNSSNITYEPNKEEILELQTQINISDDDAIIILKKKCGNIVESVLEYYENISGESYKDVYNDKRDLDEIIKENEGRENISDKEQIDVLRRILNEKDTIFQENVSKEINIDGKEKFTYINFDYNTKLFKKQTTHSDRNTLVDSLIKPYLTSTPINPDIITLENIDIVNASDKQLLCRYIGKGSRKMVAKWGLNKPAIFYYSNQIFPSSNKKALEFKNEFATKLLIKSENIKDEELLIGPVCIINEWF